MNNALSAHLPNLIDQFFNLIDYINDKLINDNFKFI